MFSDKNGEWMCGGAKDENVNGIIVIGMPLTYLHITLANRDWLYFVRFSFLFSLFIFPF